MKKSTPATFLSRIPTSWRKGQTIFNFLEYLRTIGVPTNQNARLADPFHLSDEEWDKHYQEFLKTIGA